MFDWFRDKWVRVGMEVPFVANTCFNWAEASVPHTHTGVSDLDLPPAAPPTKDYATCSIIGTPPTYLILRICKSRPHVLEILELESKREMPRVGLRIIFPDALYPFAYICENQNSPYLVYALSVSGIAYRLLLDHVCGYTGSYIFSSDEVFYFDTKNSHKCPSITAAAATTGFLVVGRSDGSVSCLRLGECDERAPGFVQEFKTTFLWGLISSKKKDLGSVRGLVITKIHGNKVVFVLHAYRWLQVWDLHRQVKLLSEYLHSDGRCMRLWVCPNTYSHNKLRFALLNTGIGVSSPKLEQIRIYSFNCSPGGEFSVPELSWLESFSAYVPEGKLIDLILTPNKVCYLRTDGLVDWTFSGRSLTEEAPYYSLQEAWIEEQLFQKPEHGSDSLYQAICSISFTSKAQIKETMSSIFLQRLLHPRVCDITVFCFTFQLYGKHWTENELEDLALDELKKEIMSMIEHEDNEGSPYSTFVCWKEFCSRYLDQWRKRNQAYCLIFDSSNQAMGVVRQNGVSLFRSLKDIELPELVEKDAMLLIH